MESVVLLSNALKDLKNASLSIHTDDDLVTTMKKYDMLFLGKKVNEINSIELRHSLEHIFNLEFTNEEQLPTVCKSLDMKLEALQSLDNLGVTTAYIITLY